MPNTLKLLLITQVVLGVLYSFASPIFEVSDEVWHYPVVREIAEGRGLPVQDPTITTPWEQEGNQPPLYYALAAGLTSWIDISDYPQVATHNPFAKAGIPGTPDNVNMVAHPPGQSPWQGGTVLAVYLIRWASVLLGTWMAYLTFRLALALFPGHESVALLAAALVAFNPMILYINGSVNNDNLIMPLTTLGLLLLVRDVQSDMPGYRWRDTLLLGGLLGLVTLTKASGLVLLPLSALAVTYGCYRAGEWRPWFVRGAVLVGVVVLMSGWWFARNLNLYGEPLGTSMLAEIVGSRPPGFGLLDLLPEWRSFWYSFWGVFGVFNVLAPDWFYALVSLLSLAGVAGLLIWLWSQRHTRLGIHVWGAHSLPVLFIAITFTSLLQWALMTHASQGRLMFASIAALMLYLARGLLALAPDGWQLRVAQSIGGLLALVAAVVALTAIAPAYRPAPPLEALPPDATSLDVMFGDSMQLVGYSVADEAPVVPGAPLAVTLYWQADQPIDANLNLALNVLGYQLEQVAKLDTWPGGGLRPTSHWQPGAVYADSYLLSTESRVETPTTITLNVSVWGDTLDDRLPITISGQPAESLHLAAGRLAGELIDDRLGIGRMAATLEHGLRLDDYQITQNPDMIDVLLVWSASEGAAPLDYTVFVHLVDGAGDTVAQGDGPPRLGYWPTSVWRNGEQVLDSHTIVLPPDLPPGAYRLRAGLYDPATGIRAQALDLDGNPWQDWAIELPGVVIP